MKAVIFFIVLVLSFNSLADSRSYDRTWLGLFGKKKISENYFVWTEGQARMDNDRFTNQQLLLRTGALRTLDEKNETGLLYCYVQTDDQREHRPTFQYIHGILKTETHNISLRNRLEYRVREDQDAISGRYRGLVRYQRRYEGNRSFVLWEEPFINLTSEEWTGKRIFERNRLFAGVNFQLNETGLEVGYLNQYTPRSDRTTIEHILALYFFY